MTETPDLSRSRAILIGAASYEDPGFLSLPAVSNSLTGMQLVLTDPDLCGWPPGQVTVLENPTDVRRVLVTMRQLARGTRDVLLIYFAGHGVLLPRGRLCLALSDTLLEEPDITGLEYDRVRDALIDSPARVKIVILDCCYSGRAIEALSTASGIADCTDTAGTYTLTASDFAAHVVPSEQQESLPTSFTGELLDLIRGGIPGGPERLTLGLIYPRLRDRLRSRNLPAPNQRGTDTVTHFPIARNRASEPPAQPAPAAAEEPGAVSGKDRPAMPAAGTIPHPARSVASGAARLLDAAFIIQAVPFCIIGLDILIPRRAFLPWPWWAVFVSSIIGIAAALGAVRRYAAPASIILWTMTWNAAYSVSVISTSSSSYSTRVAILSAECIIAAVISFALYTWILALLPRDIQNVNPFPVIFMGCFSAALILAVIALHTERGQGGLWNAVGAATLAAALGVLLTLIRAHRPGRPATDATPVPT